VNTVPTVLRLANKLQKPEFPPENPEEDVGKKMVYQYPNFPFCPLCYGVRDELKNLLEIGTTVR
jgi:hypothetical protein